MKNSAELIRASLLGLSALGCMPIVRAQDAQKPNILFIAIDDLKPNTQTYGDRTAHTPTFDSISSVGITFMNNYCQMALSGPTRASLLTGLRPDNTGVWSLQGNFRKINSSLVTLPQTFKNQGYQVVGIGKIFHPLDNKKYRDDPVSWTRYVKVTAPTYALANGRVAVEHADVPDSYYRDGIVADEAIKQLQLFKKEGKPFFLAVGFHKPHLPYVAPEKYWNLYDESQIPLAEFQQMSSDPVSYAYHESNELKVYSDIPSFHSYVDTQHLDTATQKRVMHGYYACISYVDAQLQRVINGLKAQGLDKNTIIVVWGDHGYHLGDHGLWNKLTNFENSTHTMLMMCGPGIPRHAQCKSVTEFVDVYPTLCELAQVKAPDYLDGTSLVPILKNPKTAVKKQAFSQYHRGDVQGYAIRNGRYRYVEWVKGFKTFYSFHPDQVVGTELYDYQKDPLEKRNQVHNSSYRRVVETMQQELHAYYAQQFQKSKQFPVEKVFTKKNQPEAAEE